MADALAQGALALAGLALTVVAALLLGACAQRRAPGVERCAPCAGAPADPGIGPAAAEAGPPMRGVAAAAPASVFANQTLVPVDLEVDVGSALGSEWVYNVMPEETVPIPGPRARAKTGTVLRAWNFQQARDAANLLAEYDVQPSSDRALHTRFELAARPGAVATAGREQYELRGSGGERRLPSDPLYARFLNATTEMLDLEVRGPRQDQWHYRIHPGETRAIDKPRCGGISMSVYRFQQPRATGNLLNWVTKADRAECDWRDFQFYEAPPGPGPRFRLRGT